MKENERIDTETFVRAESPSDVLIDRTADAASDADNESKSTAVYDILNETDTSGSPQKYEPSENAAPSNNEENKIIMRKKRLAEATERRRRINAENRQFDKEEKAAALAERKTARTERRNEIKNKLRTLPARISRFFTELPKRVKCGIISLPERTKKLLRTPKLLRKTITTFLLSLWALIVIFPFYWMILTSLKSYGSYNQETIPQFIAKNPTLENYVTAFTAVPLARYFLNTLIFTLLTTAVMLFVTVLASYGFARINFKGKDLIFTIFLSMMMIPAELVVITNYVTVTDLDMRNTFMGLVLPSVTSVFYIYLLKENFQQVPDEIYYAAKVDGTTDFKYMLRVMIPVCRPTVVTVTILKIIECWNSYVWPRLVTDEEEYYLVSVGIQAIRNSGFGRENVPAMMAAVTVISVPLILLFLIFRNKIMAGVARGGTKG